MKVLSTALKHYGIPVPGILYFCSLALSRQILPGLPSYSLAALAEHFCITYDAHNALSDAETCGKIIGLCAQNALARASKKRFAATTDMLRMADVELKRL
jgi:DNA polymerase-3 subunit epsilon